LRYERWRNNSVYADIKLIIATGIIFRLASSRDRSQSPENLAVWSDHYGLPRSEKVYERYPPIDRMGGRRHETGADAYSPKIRQNLQQNTQEGIDQKKYRLGCRQWSLERNLRDSIEVSIYRALSISENIAEHLSGKYENNYFHLEHG